MNQRNLRQTSQTSQTSMSQMGITPTSANSTSTSRINLYTLLPAIYRIRDVTQDRQLQAFLDIIEQELRLLETDIDRLYDNWFIETCDAWVVPYLGDLLAVRDLSEVQARLDRQERRTYVANTLAYRQRKGTTAILEQLGRDITGWGIRTVEAQPLVATSQHLSHLRPQSATVDLRQYRPADPLSAPFQATGSFTPEIRSPLMHRGRYTATGVAFYLWRLQSYAIEHSTPRSVAGLEPEPQGRYFSFNPLGIDAPLFNTPQTETEITELAQEIHVPGALTAALWQAYEEARRPVQVFFNQRALSNAEIVLADLENWQRPDENSEAIVAIDLHRGRLAVLTEDLPQQLAVNYAYGFSGDVGGGSYSRTQDTILDAIDPATHLIWQVRSAHAHSDSSASSLAAAVKEWNHYARQWQASYDLIHIPLAFLAINTDAELTCLAGRCRLTGQGLSEDDETTALPRLAPRFQPGVAQGLTVIAHPGDLEVLVTPGVAIDATGQIISIQYARTVYVGSYRSQTLLLVLSISPEADPSDLSCYQIQATPITEVNASLTVLQLGQIQTNASGQIQQWETGDRPEFLPGILDGLQVTIDATTQSVTVSPGKAITQRRKLINLTQSTSYSLADLRNWAGFLVIKPGQTAETPTLDRLQDVAGGLIQLHGNGTYAQSLVLRIPAAKRLSLVATDGDRPHIQGELRLRGTATSQTDDAGEFTLEGILLEGDLTVLPGNLQGLTVAHSTIVPGYRLQVERAELPIQDAEPDDVTLMALLIYSLTLLQRLIRVGSGHNLPLQERINRIADIVGQQITTLFQAIHQFVYRWSCPPPAKPNDEEADDPDCPDPPPGCCPEPKPIDLDQDNSRLQILLHRSICGQIHLADTVPALSIIDSIVDGNELDDRRAIIAPGTATDLQTTTVLGTTRVRTLDASDSIFTDKVSSQRQQVGCLRFCYVPEGSRTPHRYRCQPDLVLSEQIGSLPVAISAFAFTPNSSQTYVGTAGEGVYRLIPASQIWVPLPTGLNQAHVTALLSDVRSGSGTIAFTQPTNAESPILVEGQDTVFTQEVQVGDSIAVGGQSRTIIAILSDQQVQIDAPFNSDLPAGTAFTLPILLAGTTGGTLFRAVTTPIPGSGTVSSMAPNPSNQVIVVGCGTRFRQELNVGETLIVAEQRRQVIAIPSDEELTIDTPFPQTFAATDFLIGKNDGKTTRAGTGQISSTVDQSVDRSVVVGCNTRFTEVAIPGDQITVAGQTRTIVAVEENTLLVSPPFDQNILHAEFRLTRVSWAPITTAILDSNDLNSSNKTGRCNTDIRTLLNYTLTGTGKITSQGTTIAGQATQFTTDFAVGDSLTVNGQTRHITAISSDTSLTIHAPFPSDLISPTPFQLTGILAGTAGNGILRSTDGGKHWQLINQGLTHLDVRSLVLNPNTQQFFAGTQGGGVFYSIDRGNHWAGGDPVEETIRQTGLTNACITGLAVNPITGAVFASTLDGVFRSTDGGIRWQPVNQGLTTLSITSLTRLTQVGRGTIASNYTTLNGDNTEFTRDLTAGDQLTAAGQSRTVLQIMDDRTLHLDQPFDPDLPAGTTFRFTTLFAGTTTGTLFRSRNEGTTWTKAGSGLTNTEITCLATPMTPPIPPSTTDHSFLLAGTRLGSVFKTENQGDRWSSLNTGLNRVEDMLRLLNQLQPQFTQTAYGQPGYAQLDLACPSEIRTGAENASEMGVFNYLKQSQREDNLHASLTEYLRFGIQPDFIFFT